jgi:hypothetical protein
MEKNKKRFSPAFFWRSALFNIGSPVGLSMMGTVLFRQVDNRFDNTIGQPESQDRQRIPEGTVK